MSTRTRVPALGAEGWFTPEGDAPTLLGQQCTTCGTFAFPKADHGCPNPACLGIEFTEVPLSRHGTIWSYTDARYQPPPPYVVPTDTHVPFCIAAVHLAVEGIVVMGQVVAGVTVDDLSVGQEMELVVDILFSETDAETGTETDHLIWKWRPVSGTGPHEPASNEPASNSSEARA